MNNLRTPIIILVVIILALGAWYFISRQSPAMLVTQTTVSTTTSPASGSTLATEAPTTLNAAATAVNVVGTWQSTDDPNYSVVITSDGKWTDNYKGADASSSTSETGTYELFTSTNPDKDFTGVLVPGVVYVKVSEGTSVLYFSVLEASGQQLQLSYLDRGNTLSFTKEE